jgi:transposase
MAHVAGQSRYQSTLFPEVLDEVIAADCQVRVIDAFVERLDLARLGFSRVEAEATGRPPYAPGDLLKLYIYGYLNQVRSSRRLEREAERNIEVLWLLNRVKPCFKTIADFRKDHTQALVGACRAFISFCREQSLFGAELLAIDGTKIAAVASRKKVLTPEKITKMTAAIDRKIADYLAGMNEADRHERSDATVPTNVAAALEALQGRRAKLQAQAAELSREGLKQKVVGEPEAKLMRTPRGHQVAYNAQITVDAKHALVSAFDLTNDGNDEQQLHPMAVQGKAAVGADLVTVVADVGYSNGAHGAACAKDGITAVVPRAETVNTHGQQYFSRNQFSYDATSDSYRCPAGATLNCQVLSDARQRKRYATSACASCPLKPQCTKGVRRLIYRSLHEDDREAMHQRAMSDPVWMKLRRELAEHPFGTIKWLMPRFLLRGLRKAKAELALSVLGYNLKRVINILGTPTLLQVLQPTFR